MSRNPLPPPPPPPPAQRPQRKQQAAPAKTTPYPVGSFGIGVETEFLLAPRERSRTANDIREFSISVASSYNNYLSTLGPDQHPRMHNAINESYLGPQFAEWSLDSDLTIEMPKKGQAPWGLESISPIFRAYGGSRWREHIGFIWDFLSLHYLVSANSSCGTHVHLSVVGGYSLPNLKRICQSIIHFEPAFEALLSEDRLSNVYARSNWLDNSNFGHRNLSRKQSMDVIQQASNIRELVLLMNPDHDKMFGWNLLYLLNSPNGTIEFRRGAPSTSAQDVFMWIEVAMSFVQASMELGDIDRLRKVPATVGGLRWFIDSAKLTSRAPGVYDPRYLDLFFSGKLDSNFREPKPLGNISPSMINRLRQKKELDKKKNLALVKMMHEPYWA